MRALLVEPVLNAPELEPPLGLVAIATMARKRGHDVSATSLRFDLDFDRLSSLLRSGYDVVGVSTHSVTLPASRAVVNMVRQVQPNARVVVGGPHATAMPKHGMAYIKPDFLVAGEGEDSFADLLDALAAGGDGANIAGVMAATAPEAFQPRLPIADLNLIEYDRSLLDVFPRNLGVSAAGLMPDPCTTINVSRGCPARCIFCQPLVDTMFGRKLRRRSTALVGREIRGLRDEYGVSSIQLVDDTVIVRSPWGQELARELKATGLPWAINTRADLLDEPSVQLLAESGCEKVMLGIESGSQDVLDRLSKGVSIAQVHEALRLCRRYGIRVKASIMIGSPDETEEDLRLTLKMLETFRPEAIAVNYTKPTIGSYLFEQVAKATDLDDPMAVTNLSNRTAVYPGLCAVPDAVLADYRVRMLACQSGG
ncbi:MAG: B12-binding domain-containing radical SAM protein [Bacteroidota bacterium]